MFCNLKFCKVDRSAIAALPLPLQKLKTKCMLAYSAFVNMLGILTTHHHSH